MTKQVKPFTKQQFYRNEKGRDFVVGDLHGEYPLFDMELSLIGFDKERDRMFCVGDLIDRGPHSAKCLRLQKEPWFFSTYGNHEDLMLQALLYKDHFVDKMWHKEGGDWAESHSKSDIDEFVKIIFSLPQIITIHHSSGKKVGICHAQAPTNDWNDIVELTEAELNCAIWGRTVAQGRAPKDYWVKNVDLTVHGHCILRKPTLYGNSLFIDTGGGRLGRHLTIINLDEYLTGG